MDPIKASFDSMDRIIERIKKYAVQDKLDEELAIRIDRPVTDFKDSAKIFERIVRIIAYSQSAKAQAVGKLLQTDELRRAIGNYDVAVVSMLNPCDIADSSWTKISAIQKKTKIFQMVMIARLLHRGDGLGQVFSDVTLPKKITSEEDIQKFWKAFSDLQKTLKGFPFLSSTTSLLHFLMDEGYDCIKPDVIVQRVAVEFGWHIKKSKNKSKSTSASLDKAEKKSTRDKEDTLSDGKLKNIVRVAQEYAVSRQLRPAEVDLYMLIHGGQSGVKKCVTTSYYADE
ncbi:hypothetical protein FEE59_13965 [Herbaspirillum sp. RU 5E]|nr:hypothetical protein [Herbaspirillum sp. RU 5E]